MSAYDAFFEQGPPAWWTEREKESFWRMACVPLEDEGVICFLDFDQQVAGVSRTPASGLSEWTVPFSALRTKAWRKHSGAWAIGDIVLRPA